MRRTHFAAVSALALLAASCAADPAFAQNQPPSGLPPRGAVRATDVIVDQPAGSATVQGAQASAIATYVQQTAAAGTSGQVQINNGGAFAGVTVSGDGTLSGSGALTVTKINGSTPGTFAFQNYGALPSASGSPPITAATVFPCIPAGTLDGCTGAQLLAYVTNGPFGADPTGGADSTSALQAWLNAGSPGVIPCGIYKTTATLTLELALNNGQQVRGSGSGSAPLKTGGCYTVIRPTSAVAKALVIDGTPVSQYLMGIGLHDIAFDMTNMSDVSTSVAINQIQAYDVMYERVRVINDGANKRGWLFNAGAFTTTLLNTQANIVDFEGASLGNEVTTISLINADIGRMVGNYAFGVSVIGGAIQPAYNGGMSVIYLAGGAAATPPALSTACAPGCYLIVAETITNSDSFTITGDIENGGGYPSTYNDGTHGMLNAYPVLSVPSTWTRLSLLPGQVSGMYLYDLSSSTFSLGANLGGGSPYNLIDAPTTLAGGATVPLGKSLILGSSQTWPGIHVKPSADADQVFAVYTAAGTNILDCATNALSCVYNNGAALLGYSDAYSTQTFGLTTQSGAGKLTLLNAGTPTITINGANGTIQATNGLYNTPVGSSSASTVNATNYAINGNPGVSCAAGSVSLATLTVSYGIVTHC
jgi:hypothetical protein